MVGNIAYYAESTAGNDKNRAILMVYNTYESTHSDWSNDRAKVLLANGDKLTVYLDDEQHGGTLANGGSYTKAKDLKKGQMYYYEVNNDGEYALYDIKKGTKTDAGYGDVGENKEGIVNNKVGGSPIADDAIVFVYVEDNDAKMYTGKAVKDAKKNDGWGKVTLGQTGQYLTEEENGFNYARILNVQIKEKDTLDNSTDYGYVITDPIRSRNSGGNWQVEYEYWNGSENVKAIEITDNINRLDYVKGSVISFAYVSTGGDVREIRDVKLAENQVHAAMLGANKTSVRLGSIAKGEETADVDSDTIIYYVDSDATPNTSIGITGRTDYDYTVGKTRDEKYYPCNVIYILDNDETDVKFMLIDIDNRLDGKEDIPVSALNAREVKSIDELIKSMADGYKSIEVDASVNKIDEKLDILDNVRVTFKAGSVTVDTTGELNIANSAMVSFDGDLVIQGQGKVIGDVNVADIGLSSNGTIDGSITVTNVLTNTVANLKGKEGSYITLNYDGKAIANSGLYAGAKNAAQVLPTPKKGTYMWTNDVDPIGSDPADEHWYTEDKTVVGSGAAPVDSMAGADIATLLGDDAYDTVTISDLGNVGATGTTDAVNVPKNKTLVMTSSATGVTAAKLQDITGTDATSKLVLNADISGITATDWFFGDAAVTLANATSFANMTFAKADGTAITGTVPGTYVWNTNKNAWMLTKPNDDELKITFGAGSTPDQKALNNAWNITKGTITVSQAINTHVDISANKSVTLTTMPIAGGELRGDGEVILEITGAVGSLVEIAVRNVSIHATSTGIDMADLDDINTAGYVSTVVIKQGTKINQSTNADSSAYDKSKVFFNDVGAGVPAQASLAADLTFNFDAASKTFKKA